MAKLLKNGDAKLEGLMFYTMPASYRTRQLRRFMYTIRGGFHVLLKSVSIRVKYFYHLFQHRHHLLLQQDCLREEVKAELKVKALYHNSKVLELGARI
ncbi:MAG: hypothetical protein K0Q87_3781 [Neobacillus sp.]|jgi:hypothetical protein|nr:hypothetical protein [Neobacillus sp.]